jgi:hypothetical protein
MSITFACSAILWNMANAVNGIFVTLSARRSEHRLFESPPALKVDGKLWSPQQSSYRAMPK